ncbi:MAG: M1 family aminopeptidase [Polyangiales bacterium]
MLKFDVRSILFLPLWAACLDSEPPVTYAAELAELTAVSATIDAVATHYEVQLDLNNAGLRVDVTLRAQTAGDCVSVPMRIQATRVAINGVETTRVTVDNNVMTACDPAGVGYAAGTDVVLAVIGQEPIGTVQGTDIGFKFHGDVNTTQYAYMLSWVQGCDLHGPCDTRPATFASYHFGVTHPANYQVLCPGTVTRSSATFTDCRFDFWGPSYSTHGLVARSPAWTESTLGTSAGVTLKLYTGNDTAIAQQLDVTAISGSFAWLANTFGAYPYGNELRIVNAPTVWQGFEHPGLVVLQSELTSQDVNYVNDLRHVAIHELAHQWAGNQATLAGTYDFVWKEAMAEYLTYVYEDQALSPNVGAASRRSWKNAAAGASYFPVPMDRPQLLEYFGDAYGAGPMVLFRQLEVMFGRAAVLNGIRALIGSGTPRAWSIADVQAALSQAVGADLTTYFNSWVYGSGSPAWPTATAEFAETAPGSQTWSVHVNVTSVSNGTPPGCAFHVRLWDATRSAWADVGFNNGANGGEYAPSAPLMLRFTPASAEVDPDDECLVYDASVPMQSRFVARPMIF